MLVLTRKVGQKLLIGSALLTVLDVRGQRIRLGIDAPPDCAIARQEIVLDLPSPGPEHNPPAPE